MSQEKTFVNGMIVKRNEQAPDFVICGLSFKVDEIKAFLDEYNNNGWVNVQVKRSQGGKFYGELDVWEKKEPQSPPPYNPPPVPQNVAEPIPQPPSFDMDDIDDSDIPF